MNSDPDDLLQTAVEAHSPGEIESCLNAAVKQIMRCHWQARQSVMVLTAQEVQIIEQARAQDKGIVPECGPPDERQLTLAAELQEIVNPGWRPIGERAAVDE